MMLERELEPEVMDTEEEAVEYQAMDHREVNRRFAEDLYACVGTSDAEGTYLDVGTGTALIPMECCRVLPRVQFVAADLSRAMLEIGERNLARAGLSERIALKLLDGKLLPFETGTFAGVVSNSLVHHIVEPLEVFREMWRVVQPGGVWFHRDLLRPASEEDLQELVRFYAGDSTEHQRKLFADSLRAALTLEELSVMLEDLGIPRSWLRQTSDRHWTIAGRQGDV